MKTMVERLQPPCRAPCLDTAALVAVVVAALTRKSTGDHHPGLRRGLQRRPVTVAELVRGVDLLLGSGALDNAPPSIVTTAGGSPWTAWSGA